MNNIMNTLSTSNISMSMLSIISSLLLISALILGIIEVKNSVKKLRTRLILEKIIVESLAEALREKELESSIISVKGSKCSVRLKCPEGVDPKVLAEEIMSLAIKKAESKGYEIAKILDKAKENDSYISALYGKSFDVLHRRA